MKKEEQLFWKFGKDFPKGTILFREGELGRDMFIIQKGRCRSGKGLGPPRKY
jgi:CRP-like cAMP-binding protein